MHTPSTIERAFELARSGRFPTLKDVVRQLKSEGFTAVDAHVSGSSTRLQLRQLCLDNRPRV